MVEWVTWSKGLRGGMKPGLGFLILHIIYFPTFSGTNFVIVQRSILLGILLELS